MNKYMYPLCLMLATMALAQNAAKPAPQPAPKPAQQTPQLDQAQLLQQASAMYRENVILKMRLNKERLLRLQEQAEPLQRERREMIQELNDSNPGFHWDEGSESMVKDPPPPAPATPTPPADKK